MIESIGCLAALGGGLVIGSICLGIDVKTMAAVVLEKADIKVPAILAHDRLTLNELDPSGPGGEASPTATTDSQSDSVTDDALTILPGKKHATPPQRARANDEQDTLVFTAPQELAEPGELTGREKLTVGEKRAATQACWVALNQCIQKESANRSKSINAPQSWHLFDYLLRRQAGHKEVVDTITQLDQHGIDQRLRMHIQQFLAWHRAGAELYDRAAQLLTDAPAGKLSGPFAQSWQSAATQHRMEEKLILNKHVAVGSYLEHSHKRP